LKIEGTPVLGAIDDIDRIAKIASEKKIWLHVDGHLAGSCVFSSNQKIRVKGIERYAKFHVENLPFLRKEKFS